MRNIFFSTIALILSFNLSGQAPVYGYHYQAIIRNSNGVIVANQSIQLRFQILNGAGEIQYEESHLTVSDEYGRIASVVGAGTNNYGQFDTIDWTAQKHVLGISIKIGLVADWVDMGQEEIVLPPTDQGNIYVKGQWPQLHFQNQNGNKLYWEMTPGGDYYLYDPFLQKYRIMFNSDGGLGIGTTEPQAPLDVNGNIITRGSLKIDGTDLQLGTNDGRPLGNNPAQRAMVHDFNDVLKLNYNGDFEGGVYVEGPGINVATLTIRGNDLAEFVQTVNNQHLEPGMVVVYDEVEEDKIRPCDKAYDDKLPGIISDLSGTGKYRPGIIHVQPEVENGAPVALYGKVEAWAIGPVAVGDYLTTSPVKGHAMSVRNRRKSKGAIIGRATTSLNKGEKGKITVFVQRG